ncbi:MAG: glycosyltransferase family 9 protein [Endomicrobiia bacterium]|nr:glycosyltransferase family 9 protein [Endomicrobiia bacterium]
MKLSTMKSADKYAGWFLCAALSMLQKFLAVVGVSPAPSAPLSVPPSRILVMKFWGLGSIILSSPLVKTLRAAFPSAKITFLTLERNRRAAESLEIFDDVMAVDVDRGLPVFLLSLASAILAARRRKFDVCFDLEFFTRFSAVVTYLVGAPVRVGYHSFSVSRGNLHNIKVPFNRYWHVTKNFLNLGSALGVGPSREHSCAAPNISAADESNVEKILAAEGLNVGESVVCMHANASDLALERRWPYENFASLCAGICRLSPSVKIIFVGTKVERDSVERIKAAAGGTCEGKILNLAGRLGISELAYLFKKSLFAVCNDSGPLHLACAVGARTVSLFGPETPVIYGPTGPGHIIFFKNIDCSPCVNVHDGKSVKCSRMSPECLERISPDEVLAAIREKGWL